MRLKRRRANPRRVQELERELGMMVVTEPYGAYTLMNLSGALKSLYLSPPPATMRLQSTQEGQMANISETGKAIKAVLRKGEQTASEIADKIGFGSGSARGLGPALAKLVRDGDAEVGENGGYQKPTPKE